MEDTATKNVCVWFKVTGPGTADATPVILGLGQDGSAKRNVDKKEVIGFPWGKVGSKQITKDHRIELNLLHRTARNVALFKSINPNDYESDGHMVDNDQNIKVTGELYVMEIDDSETGGWDGDYDSVPGTAVFYPNCTVDAATSHEYKYGEPFAGHLSLDADFDAALNGFADIKEVAGVDCSDDSTGFTVDGTTHLITEA
jgi:hypothetical protein